LSLQVTSELGQAPTFGDPALVERLVANLIDNAVQHNFAAGRVSVRTGTHEGRALLTVTNTGPVIPRDQVDRLLEPFQRLGTQRTSSGHEGHGLGLSIVRAIASAHDASLKVLPQAGGGLAVTVSFPAPAA
jgi:signal transduction histidine kinase